MTGVNLVVDALGVWLVLPDGRQIAAEPGVILAHAGFWLWLPDAHFRTVVRNDEVFVARHRGCDQLFAWDLTRMGIADVRVDGDTFSVLSSTGSVSVRDPHGAR